MPTVVTGHIVDVTVVMYLTVAAVTGPTAASNSMTWLKWKKPTMEKSKCNINTSFSTNLNKVGIAIFIQDDKIQLLFVKWILAKLLVFYKLYNGWFRARLWELLIFFIATGKMSEFYRNIKSYIMTVFIVLSLIVETHM
jgi:hypothetical protein